MSTRVLTLPLEAADIMRIICGFVLSLWGLGGYAEARPDEGATVSGATAVRVNGGRVAVVQQ